jgi:hypothetical protein
MLEWEYLLLWMSLAVALTVSLLAIIWPLHPFSPAQDHKKGKKAEGHLGRTVYFASLGLAFFFLEIAFMQRFILFLSHPMQTMAVIVPSFLFFAGCGSGYADKTAQRMATSRLIPLRDRPMALATAGIVIVSLIYLWLLPFIFRLVMLQLEMENPL